MVQISYLRLGLGGEVRNVGGARRMQQIGLPGFRGDLEDREEARLVEAGAVDVGVKLQPVGVAVDQDALGLLHRRVGRRSSASAPT